MRRKDREVRHVVELTVGSRALVPQTRAELRALGYRLVPAREAAPESGDEPPALRIVDERYLDRIPAPEEDPRTPIVVLTGPRPLALDDSRIAGRAVRPAGTLDLYPLLQKALERHPRRVPRVPTQLPARCIRADHRWPGAVLSLSEDGCLLQTTESLRPGSRFGLQFAIPGGDLIMAQARCVYSGDARAGVAFSDPSEVDRRIIRGYVSQRLARL